MNRQSMEWEIFVNVIFDKGLLSNIDKGLIQFSIKKLFK